MFCGNESSFCSYYQNYNKKPLEKNEMIDTPNYHTCIIAYYLSVVREYKIIIPPVHPVSSAALWPWVCWEQDGGSGHWAQVRGTPTPPLEAGLEPSHAWRWRAQHPPKWSPVRLLTIDRSLEIWQRDVFVLLFKICVGIHIQLSVYISKLQVRLEGWVLNTVTRFSEKISTWYSRIQHTIVF